MKFYSPSQFPFLLQSASAQSLSKKQVSLILTGFISTSKWPKVDEKKIVSPRDDPAGPNKGSSGGDLNSKIVERIKGIVSPRDDSGEPKKVNKVYVYVMPFEVGKVDGGKIGKAIGLDVKGFAVNDSGKVDPKGMAKRAKPGLAAIYLE